MKQLQLDLNKRLLIVEGENANEFCIMKNIPAGTYEIICKGSEITEGIFSIILDFDSIGNNYVDYKKGGRRFSLGINSFISAIESKGWFWRENPVKEVKEDHYYFEEDHGEFGKEKLWDGGAYQEDLKVWQEAESRTFNPSKCLIFEIV